MEYVSELLKEYEVWVALGLLTLIAFFIWKRIPGLVAKQLDSRAAAIAKELEEAKRLREEAAAVLASYAHKAQEAEAEAAKIVADAKEEAERFAVESRAQLKAQIERRAVQAKEKIAQAENAALDEIRALAADKAVAAAEALITAHLDAARSDTLVKDSIAELAKAS